MHIDITPEVLVSQLKIGHGETIISQVENTIKNTKNFNDFSKHILSLNDKLKHMNGYVALSNTHPYFKIKCDSIDNNEIIKEFKDELEHWSDKYHVELQKVENKEVYYILGKN
ncbi:MAG: hypothetical protein U9R37_07315 [Campylobacterota bacterium]|nr:hypothetical protein [Campylobacterota bacterium]